MTLRTHPTIAQIQEFVIERCEAESCPMCGDMPELPGIAQCPFCFSMQALCELLVRVEAHPSTNRQTVEIPWFSSLMFVYGGDPDHCDVCSVARQPYKASKEQLVETLRLLDAHLNTLERANAQLTRALVNTTDTLANLDKKSKDK